MVVNPDRVLCTQISVHRLYKHHLGPALPLPLRLWMLLPSLTHLAGDFGNLRFLLCIPTAVFQSWLCFQGECKDLGLVKGTETNLSPLLLGRYSLLESSSLSFRKRWALNAIYSRCIRSQMLIFLWHIPEAFVLTEEINAAPDKCGSLLLCGRCTPPARGESGAVLISQLSFPVETGSWSWEWNGGSQ